MKINFSPQVRDDIRLKSLKKHGDILIINGKKYDLKRFAYDEWNEWISNVIYNETEQRCDVLLPIPHGAPYSARFPAPIYVTADGDIPIPCTKNLESNYTEIVVKYGLIPELVGRVPVVVSLEMLDKEALIRILTEPRNAITKQYQKMLELDGVELTFDDEALEAIAETSLKRKTGARGLRAIMENVMMDIMYKAPSDETLKACRITEDVVKGGGVPLLEHNSVRSESA